MSHNLRDVRDRDPPRLNWVDVSSFGGCFLGLELVSVINPLFTNNWTVYLSFSALTLVIGTLITIIFFSSGPRPSFITSTPYLSYWASCVNGFGIRTAKIKCWVALAAWFVSFSAHEVMSFRILSLEAISFHLSSHIATIFHGVIYMNLLHVLAIGSHVTWSELCSFTISIALYCNKYFVIFINDFSCQMYLYLIKEKSDMLKSSKYINII